MNSIKNYVPLTDCIATAGQPTLDQFKLIADSGYEYIINLGMPDHPHAVSEQDKAISELGLTYIHIPVKFDAPTKGQVRFFCNLMASLRGSKVFVHCIMNFRVSAFMYHYLSKVERQGDDQARSLMFNYWKPDPVWEDLLLWTSEDIGL